MGRRRPARRAWRRGTGARRRRGPGFEKPARGWWAPTAGRTKRRDPTGRRRFEIHLELKLSWPNGVSTRLTDTSRQPFEAAPAAHDLNLLRDGLHLRSLESVTHQWLPRHPRRPPSHHRRQAPTWSLRAAATGPRATRGSTTRAGSPPLPRTATRSRGGRATAQPQSGQSKVGRCDQPTSTRLQPMASAARAGQGPTQPLRQHCRAGRQPTVSTGRVPPRTSPLREERP